MNIQLYGLDSLSIGQEREQPQLRDQFEHFIRNNASAQRGTTFQMHNPNLILPIPYPRIFAEKAFTADGLIAHSQSSASFVEAIPYMAVFTQDHAYQAVVKESMDKMRTMSAKVKVQLVKEEFMEEDDIKENWEKLSGLYEAFESLKEEGEEEKSESEESKEAEY